MPLRIVCDENIPYAEAVFGSLGDVQLLPGREIQRHHLLRADLLVVRSVTKVNESLLSGTPVKMVCSATIGTDHVDLNYLQSANVAFANAPGCNADAVVNYVVAAILNWMLQIQRPLDQITVGIVGVGNIGGRLERLLTELGVKTLVNDPPLQRVTGNPRFRSLHDLLEADVLTLHVPLSVSGPDRTFHLLDGNRLLRMKPGSLLINTSRGPVVDNSALLSVLRSGHLGGAVLDVWEGEPEIDMELVERVWIGTPHVAGYSFEGKVNGTQMTYQAACSHFGLQNRWNELVRLPPPRSQILRLTSENNGLIPSLHRLVSQVYNIRDDDRRFRAALKRDPDRRGQVFDRLRKEYPMRREFASFKVMIDSRKSAVRQAVAALGFQVIDEA